MSTFRKKFVYGREVGVIGFKETYRLRAVSTYHVLVDAVSSFFCGQQLFLWSAARSRLAPVELIHSHMSIL